MPRGVQAGTLLQEAVLKAPEEEETVAAVASDVEFVAQLESAMAAAMGDAECIKPTYNEAKKRPDWPKWQDAI